MFPDPLVVLLPSVIACLYKQRPMIIPHQQILDLFLLYHRHSMVLYASVYRPNIRGWDWT